MNVFELLAFIVIVAIVVMVARFLGAVLGVNPWWIGAVLGALLITSAAIWGWHANRTEFPPCLGGRCQAKDYHAVEGGLKDNGVVVECRCGTRYLRTWDRRLMVLQDEKAVPFKRQVRWGRWIDDPSNGPDGRHVDCNQRGSA